MRDLSMTRRSLPAPGASLTHAVEQGTEGPGSGSTTLTRRAFLAAAALASAALDLRADPPPTRTPLGVVLYSYSIRSKAEKDRGFNEPLHFLEFCAERGAAGVQLPLGNLDAEAAKKLRARAEKLGMYLEGSVHLPRDEADVGRFETEVRAAREAGVEVLRTVLSSGRRYELFKSADEFQASKKQARRSLELAEPVAGKHKVRLAVENHKDYRASELAELMRGLASERIGVCVDTGNNLALLEEPQETVEALATWVHSCHLKDMGVNEYEDGFYLSEMPLGDGFLDLKRLVGTLRKTKPDVRFNLEMITRDPLKVPCLTEEYWSTMGEIRGRELARALALVRKQGGKALPHVNKLSEAEQLETEDGNVRRSLEYGRKHLG